MAKSANAETKNRYAICIGINCYNPDSQLSDLRYAENDAASLHDLLLLNDFAPEHCCLLLGAGATLAAIQEALETFLLNSSQSDDLVLFYFAGHGVPIPLNSDEDDGEPVSDVFLTSYDFPRQQIVEKRGSRLRYPLRMENLRKQFFEGTRSKKVLFLFDSCHSGDFFGPRYRDEESSAGLVKQAFAHVSAGRVVLSSCMPQQKAREDEQLRHGVFTYHLLEALEGHAPEAIGYDGWMTVGSLFDYLSRKLPEHQRPVRGGVEHGTFQLLHYPERVRRITNSLRGSEDDPGKKAAKIQRLRAMIIEHRGFMNNRLSSFVGRAGELTELHRRIDALLETGGYVTITGQAGQGKSSIGAQLVQERGPEKTPHHFIPFNPGPDYQVSLLRDLMAQIIIKYDLSDLYVASESRAALRDYFPKVLAEMVTKGGQEVIFIDGLDQLKEDANGERDLSFLPTNPPPGVVFVLGTRPNDTLAPLELLKPHNMYLLPNLSRQDFDLILEHRDVHLNTGLANQFYKAMQENALYLDLVAKELAQEGAARPEEIIQRLAANPENIFSLSIDRLKRKPHDVEWREILKPVLGLLLVAREPLTRLQIKQILHLRQLTHVDDFWLRESLARLGGLVADDGRQRYSLFHLKLYDYLRQDERNPRKEYIFTTDEEEAWHKTLADWCEMGRIAHIWEDEKRDLTEQGRRVYAREHYITHLYEAKQWSRMFAVLDEREYGRGKVRYDLSMRTYAQDLDLGRRAAAWEGWTLDEGITHLPHLWRYTLLRCSLASRADRYPLPAFRLLVLLNRTQEALGLAELLTDPIRKVGALIHIAKQLYAQPGNEREGMQVLLRASTVTPAMGKGWLRSRMLHELGHAFILAGEFEQAESVMRSVGEGWQEAWALSELGNFLSQIGEQEKAQQMWAEAEVISNTIEAKDRQARVLIELAYALAQWQQIEQAEHILNKVEAVIDRIKDSYRKVWALYQLGGALEALGQHNRALSVWSNPLLIAHAQKNWWELKTDSGAKGVALAWAQRWQEAKEVIPIEGDRSRAWILNETGVAMACLRQWQDAEDLIRSVRVSTGARDEFTEKNQWKGWALGELGIALARAGEWSKAEEVIRSVEDISWRTWALSELGVVLAQAQAEQEARVLWTELEAILQTTGASHGQRELIESFSRIQVWAQENRLVSLQELNRLKIWALLEIDLLLAEDQEMAEAPTIFGGDRRLVDLAQLSAILANTRQWESAEAVIRMIGEISQDTWGIQAQQQRAWNDFAKALAVSGESERALTIIQSLNDEDWKLDGSMVLCKTLVQQGKWNRSIIIALTMRNNREKISVLSEVGKASVAAGSKEQANETWAIVEEIISSASNNEDDLYYESNERSWRELIKAVIQVQEWERAERIINRMQIDSSRISELIGLGEALAQAGEKEKALEVCHKAEEFIKDDSKYEYLCKLGSLLALLGENEKAEIILGRVLVGSHRLRDNHRGDAIYSVCKVLGQMQKWERAREVADLIEEHEPEKKATESYYAPFAYRAKSLAILGTALAQAQEWNHAERVISMIEEKIERVRALSHLAVSFTQAQKSDRATTTWTRALDLLDTLEPERRLVEASFLLCDILISVNEWERVETLADRFESYTAEYSTSLFSTIGSALIKAREWERAVNLIGKIEESPTRATRLNDLAIALAVAGKYERLLRLVHYWWLRVDNRFEALQVTNLAYSCVQLHPEIGFAFAEAFDWVDTFLQNMK